MTDKQIIIDGVDVSGCEDYKCDGTCANSAYHLFNFETKYANCQNPNCYYKQLKRKEQECEKLKTQYNCYACGTCNGKEDYRNLEKHHIGLRKSFDELHKQLDQLKAENKELKEELEELKEENEYNEANAIEFKQTLTEIKEIAERGLNCSQCSCGAKADLDLILQKINEVMDD